MKKKILSKISIILLAGILLSACTTMTTNWGGVSATDAAVYFAGGTQVFSLQPSNGSKIWAYPEKAAPAGTYLAAPSVAGDQVIVGDYLGKLVSLKAADSTVNWTFANATGKYVGSALVTPDLIIAPNADNHLYALDLNGNLKWTFTANHSFWSRPVTDGTNVYASSLDHYLYAVNLQDGSLVWKVDLGSSLVSSPLLDKGVLYQGSIASTMNAVDAATGKVIWTQKVDAGVWSTPLLSGSNILFGDQLTSIYVMSTSDGSIVKTINAGAAVIGSGAILNQTLMFGSEAGNVVMVNPDYSSTSRSLGGELYSNLVANSTEVLVVETKGDNALLAIDANGNVIWPFSGK